MTTENIIKELERYRQELVAIMARYTPPTSSDVIHHHHINPQDEPRFRTFVIEINDFLNDSIGKNQYSPLINQIFYEGISNYYESPSRDSVEKIISVLDSVITRLKRNPELCNPKKENTPSERERPEFTKGKQKDTSSDAVFNISHSTITVGDKNKIQGISSQENSIQTTTPPTMAVITKILIGIFVAVVAGLIVWYLTK
jgi:hypothetical protein